MKKKLKTVRMRLEYGALRTVELLIRPLPRPLALRLGAWTGAVMFRCGIYRALVEKNMAHVFGEWTKQHRADVVRRLYKTTGRYFADFLRPSSIMPPHTLVGLENLHRACDGGSGTIALCAHFGNWEMMATIFGKRLEKLHVVAKPMHNRLVERWLAKKRMDTGVVTISTRRALPSMVRALRRNRVVAILIDQNARKGKTVAPFLGKPANTVQTVAMLMRRTGCAVVGVYALLQKDGSYRVVCEETEGPGIDPEHIDEYMDTCVRQHNEIISRWIREHPDHWFGWFHRRFRGHMDYRSAITP